MKAPVKKQYLSIGNLPVLTHTLKRFNNCPHIDDIYLVVPVEDHDFVKSTVLSPIGFLKPLTLVSGGNERQDSVFNGLSAIKNPSNDDLILIHDGVRPFVDDDCIHSSIESARKNGAAIVALPAFETIKKVRTDNTISTTLNRNEIWLAQTPQTFQHEIIIKAHNYVRSHSIPVTDDASCVEAMGGTVHIVPGSRRNIKITQPEDLAIAELFLSSLK